MAPSVIIADPTPTTVSPNSSIYSATTFPLSKDLFTATKQLKAIAALEARFSLDHLCNHQFEWIQSYSENQDDEWLPHYTYWKPQKNKSLSIEDVWNK